MEKYNLAWNGMVIANMNRRYHDRKATSLDAGWGRTIAKLIAIVAFALPMYLESYYPKNSKRKKVLQPLIFTIAIIAFITPEIFLSEFESESQAEYHRLNAAEWNSLESDWTEAFNSIYWKTKTIPIEQLADLKQRQLDISESETDSVDVALIKQCQKNAVDFLTVSIKR